MSTPPGGSGSSEQQSTGGDIEEVYRRRLILFTVLVAVIAAVGLWMAYTSIDQGRGSLQLTTLTSGIEPRPGQVTLVARMLPKGRDGLGRRLVKSPTVKDLAGSHRPFLARTVGGRKALCVGLFDSADAGKLEDLQQRFREFTVDGEPVFPRARPRRIGR